MLGEQHMALMRVWRSGCKSWEPTPERGFRDMNIKVWSKYKIPVDSELEEGTKILFSVPDTNTQNQEEPGVLGQSRLWELQRRMLLRIWEITQMHTMHQNDYWWEFTWEHSTAFSFFPDCPITPFYNYRVYTSIEIKMLVLWIGASSISLCAYQPTMCTEATVKLLGT